MPPCAPICAANIPSIPGLRIRCGRNLPRGRNPEDGRAALKPRLLQIAELTGRVDEGREGRLACDFAVMAQSPAHRGKRQLLPGNLVEGEEADFLALRTGRDVRRRQM